MLAEHAPFLSDGGADARAHASIVGFDAFERGMRAGASRDPVLASLLRVTARHWELARAALDTAAEGAARRG